MAATRNVEGLYIGCNWPSFSTSLNPGRHGLYWIFVVRPDAYAMRILTTEELSRGKSLWEFLGDAGKRVVVMDVPYAQPSRSGRGIEVIEWGAHDAILGFRTTPAQLAGTLLERIGPHPGPRVCDTERRGPAEYREFADQLIRGAGLRGRMTEELLASGDWDFALQVFGESHCAGHQLWHTHDPRHPGFDPTGTDLVRDVYQSIDRAVGEIIAAQHPDTTIAVMALHGMRTMYGCHPLTDDILLKLGYMTRASTTAHDPATGGATLGGKLRRLYRMLPEAIRRPIYELRAGFARKVLGQGQPLDLDPARSVCFDVGLEPTTSAIRFNIRGREPQGIVDRGAECDRLADELTEVFLELVHPETGSRLVRRVVRSADLYHGPYVDELPDLLIEWETDPPLGTSALPRSEGSVIRVYSPRVGHLECANSYCRTGDHEIGGMIAIRGPGIPPGRVPGTISTLDLAPTFTRIFGLEFEGVDGKSAPELLGSAADSSP